MDRGVCVCAWDLLLQLTSLHMLFIQLLVMGQRMPQPSFSTQQKTRFEGGLSSIRICIFTLDYVAFAFRL